MAKSTRSKVKRAFRAKKRTEGVFAAADAARLQRLNSKLCALTTTATAVPGGEDSEEKEQDVDLPVKDAEAGVDVEMVSSPTEGLDVKTSEKPTGKISTHGPRGSRRERWRTSKGMTPRPKSRGMNRQGTVASRHKPGRSHRRR
ncbi:hypothetical protein DFH94DRAFT_258602 [Russula ochroleuca]|uniref:DUF2423 domain-containing protein n=1 Tax=Russula ochroleuca TaxID=152965 RepID=A0A9P5TCI0_9AGAM|nr:hypothetical protein DFH94DRAFT_258602 [Russula ochroleuca]